MTADHHEIHPIPPFYGMDSKILILGSFPSVKSREAGFFYQHPQNRFWKVLANIYETDIPQSIDDKRKLLQENHIALWDVIESCDIVGSADASIKNVTVNDLFEILKVIRKNTQKKEMVIFTNGEKACQLYRKYMEPIYKIKAVKLPSTSPANAALSLQELCLIWKNLLQID